MSANDKTAVGGGSGEWMTPPALFQMLNRRWHFDFDMWASHENALTKTYATPEGTFRKDSSKWLGYVQIDTLDGLHFEPTNRRAFGNPPFTRGLIGPCIDYAIQAAEVMECMALLVPASTETEWFQRAYSAFGEPIWLPRRVKFIHPFTRCINRKGEECTHALGEPAPDAPSGMAIFEANIPKQRWLEAL